MFGFAGFFTHLAVEKHLKRQVAVATGAEAPRVHNLVRLAMLARIELSEDATELLFRLTRYCIEGRYPEIGYQGPSEAEVAALMRQSEEWTSWLTRQY